MYGDDFSEYVLERQRFWYRENKREKWLWAGILVQYIIAALGVILLPTKFFPIWSAALIASVVLTTWGLVSIWWKQRKFSSFEKWLKYRERERDPM